MHYQENLQQNVEIIQLSVHMFEESLGEKLPMLDKVGWNNFWICIFFWQEFSRHFIRAIKCILEYIYKFSLGSMGIHPNMLCLIEFSFSYSSN